MDYYSAGKKNEFMTIAVKLMKLDAIIQREVTQTQRGKQCLFLFPVCGC